MSGFCTRCGTALATSERCPQGHLQTTEALSSQELSLPKADTRQRLLGSGIEFAGYFMALHVLLALSAVSIGVLDGAVAPILALLILVRDVRSGLFSVAKRLGRMRVVDHRTGQPASNLQAVGRNSYYILLTLLLALPILPADLSLSALFNFFLMIDLVLIIYGDKGRRLGDRLARTQVVGEAPRGAS